MEEERETFDEFKNRVYKDIGLLESLNVDILNDLKPTSIREGFFKIVFARLANWFLPYTNRKMREVKKIDALSEQADEFLSRLETKEELCGSLDPATKLPIDIANSISPVLYTIADEGGLLFDTMLWAIISKKIADRGVVNYCR